mgnify:CR=1 FL=1
MRIRTVDDITNKNISTFLSLLVLASGMGIAIASFGFSVLLFILLVCVGCYVLFNPWHGFLTTIFFLPFSGIQFEWITGVQIPVQIIPSQFLGVLTLIGYLLMGKRLKFTRQDRALLVFFVIALFTSLINYPRILSVDIEFVGGIFRNPAGRYFAQLFGLGLMIGLYLLTANILTTQQRLNRTLKLFLGSLFITSIFAIYQFIGYFYGLPLVEFTYYPALKEVIGPGIVGDFARVGSVAGEPRQLSYVLLPGIFILLPLVALKPHPFKSRVVPSIFLFSIFVAFVFTFARSGWVSFIVSFLASLILLLFYKSKVRLDKKLLASLTSIVLLVVFFVVLDKIISWSGYSLSYSVIERFFSIEDTWTESYIENIYLNETWKLAISNFLWGVGFGNSSFYITVKPYVDLTGTYLRLLSETGIFGLLTFLWFLSGNLIYSIRAMRKTPEDGNRVIILTLLAGVLSLLINWIHYGQDFNNPIIWVLLGMLKASAKLGYNMRERS